MSFFTKIASHARNEVIGLLNPNRRHDDPEEQKADEIRAAIRASHRFESFAEERTDNFVKWHIDGYDYFWAVSEMIENAKECVFILDWWLTPEIYLRRPPALYPEFRIDRLLQRKAKQGVKIYVVVYKEVTQTMSMSSAHTKKTLSNLHPNIQCLRHPDHIGAKDSIQFWSHHEKVVVVDNHFAAVGGLDLCFGRWDTHTHPLADVHPTNFHQTLFPGQDYNNARVMDFQQVWNYSSNQVSILETPRMPWHDVHMTFVGPAVLDIVEHFVERWNEIKKRKYRDREEVDWLALPHDIEAMPNEAVAQHPHRETWHEKGHRYRERFHRYWRSEEEDDDPEERRYRRLQPASFSCRVQVCRSISDWSHGYLTEHSIQNAYIQLIDEAKHFIYIENQFFITNTVTGESVTNQIGAALVRRVLRAAEEGQKFKVVIVIPEVPGFSGDIKDESAIQTIMAAQWRSINRGGDSIYEKIRAAGHEPTDYIRFFHLRAYDRINNPSATLISQMEENSGVSFHEAQVALSRQWIGDPSELLENYQTEVTIRLPEPTGEGIVETDKTGGKIVTVKIPESEEAARDTVEKFEHGSDAIRGDENVSDSVAQHRLLDSTNLMDELWMGSEQEELNGYVSELLYIHSKLMIVDDRRVIMGSANINDRSQKGDGDSEIALVVDDTDEIDSAMNGEPFRATRFAASLRRKLYREHLGLIEPQVCSVDSRLDDFKQPAPTPNPIEFGSREDTLVADPICQDTWNLWTDTAKKNRRIFQDVFRPVPSDLVRSWSAYSDYKPKVKVGHVIPGFSVQEVKERLSEIRGALVEAPLDFLIEEKDLVTGAEWTALNPTLPIYI